MIWRRSGARPKKSACDPYPAHIAGHVRFLRQQGDVVIRAGANYLVNGRFELDEDGLVARADRIRRNRGVA